MQETTSMRTGGKRTQALANAVPPLEDGVMQETPMGMRTDGKRAQVLANVSTACRY
jgi:hypothetical protein